MSRIYTSNGNASVEVMMTDAQAAAFVSRIPATHKDRGFGLSIVKAYNGRNFTGNQRVWLHILANAQQKREQPKAAPVAALPAPVASAPVAVLPKAVPVAAEPAPAPMFSAEELDAVSANAALTMLMYDIPQSADVANPSGRLRMRGMRINKSVWIVPTAAVPHYLIQELRNVGAIVITAPYDLAASKTLLQAAINFANHEIAETNKRAEQSARDAIAELDASEENPNRAARECEKKLSGIVKRLQALEAQMKEGAKVFGLSGAINFGDLHRAANVVRTVTDARAALFAQSAEAVAAINTGEAQAMASAMKADAVPAGVAADFLMEHGAEAVQLGESLAAAHNDSATDDEGDVFDLV